MKNSVPRSAHYANLEMREVNDGHALAVSVGSIATSQRRIVKTQPMEEEINGTPGGISGTSDVLSDNRGR